MKPQIKKLIDKLELKPHPEGGYFKETYRSSGLLKREAQSSVYSGDRHYSTCIYFLLTADEFSAFHKIHQDEVWHFYKGSSILLHMITQDGGYSLTEIGNDVEAGQIPQFVVPGGVWFASEVKDKNSYALVGCTVAPGFDFQDFELAKREELLKDFSQHESEIVRLTRA